MAYKSEETHMLKALRMSKALKEKAGWSRLIGAGFIVEDITKMNLSGKDIHFTFGWGEQTIAIKDLNLRETEEAIKFLEDIQLSEAAKGTLRYKQEQAVKPI